MTFDPRVIRTAGVTVLAVVFWLTVIALAVKAMS